MASVDVHTNVHSPGQPGFLRRSTTIWPELSGSASAEATDMSGAVP